MSGGAKVHDLDALVRTREALCAFGAEVREALISADADIQRMFEWLQEELKWWQKEVVRRQDLVGQARNALNHKKLERMFGRKPDLTEEEKAYRRAKMRLEQAEEKVVRIRKAIPELQRAVMLYQGPARQLAAYLDTQLPRTLHWLSNRCDALEEYVRLAPPSVLTAAGGEEQTASQRVETAATATASVFGSDQKSPVQEIPDEPEHEPGTDSRSGQDHAAGVG